MTNLRVGNGYDVHQLVKGRDLIIGGVKIDYENGLKGHSDADVLIHAIIDALLGAAGLADIGQYFPPDDEKYKDIKSTELLESVLAELILAGFVIVNIDAVIMAEKPKMNPIIPEMRDRISTILKITKSQINIKATTTEKLGFVGREEGIAASAVCLLEKNG